MKPTPRLSDDDARVLDALAEDGLDPSRIDELDPRDRPRAEALLRMLSRLESPATAVPPESLVASVMQRVDEAQRAERRRMRIGAGAAPRRRIRLPDILTVAASLLLLLGVGWPVMSAVRGATWREQCERNLASIHTGLAGYARDHGGDLPLSAGFGSFLSPGDRAASNPPSTAPDWRVYRHGAALERLAERNYIVSRCLTCPGCEKDRGALALRVPAAGQRFTTATIRGMLVSDANPAIDVLCEGRDWRPASTQCSQNHSQRGQNVLFDDGSVRWLISPMLPGGDCIWTPSGIAGDALAPGSLPSDPDDHFLAQ